MQIDISFEQEDLQDLYDNWGAQAPDKLNDDEKIQWLKDNYLTPYLDNCLLEVIGQSKTNKAYDVAKQAVIVEQEELATKVKEIQDAKKDPDLIVDAESLSAEIREP